MPAAWLLVTAAWAGSTAEDGETGVEVTTSAGAAVGTTFASNLDHAAATAEAAAGLGAQVTAQGSVGLAVGDGWAGLGAQGTCIAWPAYPDLTTASVGLALPLAWMPGSRFMWGVMPRVTARLVSDAGRSAIGPGITGSVRYRLVRTLSARVGGSYAWIPAAEPVFEERTARAFAGLDLRPARHTFLYGEVSLAAGPSVIYVPAPATQQRATGPTGDGKGDGDHDGDPGPDPIADDTFGTGLLATQVPGTGVEVLVEAEQELTAWSFARVRGGWSRWTMDRAGYDQWTATLELGVRTP